MKRSVLKEKLSFSDQSRITAEHTRIFDTFEIISIGMGWFFSIRGVFAILLIFVFLKKLSEELAYAMKKSPIVLGVSDPLNGLSHNDYVRVRKTLDYEMALQGETVGGQLFSLIPIQDSEGDFIVFREGVIMNEEIVGTPVLIEGRVVEKDFSDKWDTGYLQLNITQQYSRAEIPIGANPKVIVDGMAPKLEIWPLILLLTCIFLASWFFSNIVRTIGFFRNRNALAHYLNKVIKR